MTLKPLYKSMGICWASARNTTLQRAKNQHILAPASREPTFKRHKASKDERSEVFPGLSILNQKPSS